MEGSNPETSPPCFPNAGVGLFCEYKGLEVGPLAPQPSEPSLCLEGKFLFRRNSDTHFAHLPKFAWPQILTVMGTPAPAGVL